MKTPTKPKRIKPFTPHWERMANSAARCYAPEIIPCKDCGGAVVTGYCCNRCGSNEPR